LDAFEVSKNISKINFKVNYPFNEMDDNGLDDNDFEFDTVLKTPLLQHSPYILSDLEKD